ncbi:MAG TPA: D-amino-acid transaminase [Sphingomonas sp.]|uniref:D-amino-acid transaminase n=1 Tax=Sphingomonas sp. TaxID=28214 RepID=UPI002C8BB19B|nr:D-amino-acid transaminase [Sphingomonas sp.]HMI21169.1 D-amino-acid transaminase [Sphingomonas sp.]
MERIAWLNGDFVPLAEAKVSAQDRGFLFADGIYEFTAVLDGKLIDSQAHLARFERSAAGLDLTLPISTTEIEAAQRELIARNRLDQGGVYFQLTGGPAERDFLAPSTDPTLFMFTQAGDVLDRPTAKTGIAIKTIADPRWARRDIKSIMLLGQVLAKREAAAAGAQEAWLVDGEGFVTEGASSSALIVTAEGTLVTRPNSQAILPGCTRKAVLMIAERDGVKVEERLFTVDEALRASEAILTSASNFVLPVVMIDGQSIGDGKPGPITRRLRELYIEAARAE